MSIVSGLDLAASGRRCSGFASVDANKWVLIDAGCLFSDAEIIERLGEAAAIGIDSPLTLVYPGGFRVAEKKLLRRGFRLLPPNWEAMRRLAFRASRLAGYFRQKSIPVLETHPRSALLLSGCRSPEQMVKALGLDASEHIMHVLAGVKDAGDAFVSAIVALYCLLGVCNVYYGPDSLIFLAPRIC